MLSVHNPPMIPFPRGGQWCRMCLVCHWIFQGNIRGWGNWSCCGLECPVVGFKGAGQVFMSSSEAVTLAAFLAPS